MKVVINKCYGGYGLSARGVQRFAELKGRACYFFTKDIKAGLDSPYLPATQDEADHAFIFYAFDIPNPNEVLKDNRDWHDMSADERKATNEQYAAHHLDTRPEPRHDPDLVRVVEELGGTGRGTGANGQHAELAVIDIPDGVDYWIDEYDGVEYIAEAHRTWR